MEKDQLLHKALNREATKEELEILNLSPAYSAYLKIAHASQDLVAPDNNSSKNLELIQNKLKEESKIRKLAPIKSIFRVAAIFTVLFCGYLFVKSLDTTISTGIAERETIVLPDNSSVSLNSSSSLTYNKSNWDKNRSLKLAGEAYFKVEKGQKFDVQTNNGVVSVLGTEFNVSSRDSFLNVDCYEGIVSVQFNDTLIKLQAGNKLKIEDNRLLIHTSTLADNPSWIYNESSFDNSTLSQVLSEFQTQYPVKINLKDKKLLDTRFSGSFTHEDMEIALHSICDPLRLKYTINNNEVSIYAQSTEY